MENRPLPRPLSRRQHLGIRPVSGGAQLRRQQQIRAIAARLRGEFRDLAQVVGNRTWLAGRGADGYVYLFLNQ
jgi:hypothetical protein